VPDRIIRDEIRRSHRFVHLPSDTHRVLFYHLVLDADDFGNAEATTTNLSLIMARPVSEELAASWLSTLADVDLIRIYEFDGKRYVHLPRFRQRLRSRRGKHPQAPPSIECNEMKMLRQNVGHMPDVRRTDVGHLPPKRSEVKGIEVKGIEGKGSATASTQPEANKPTSSQKPIDKSLAKANPIGALETQDEYAARLSQISNVVKAMPKA
jgi:hypothetical protein